LEYNNATRVGVFLPRTYKKQKELAKKVKSKLTSEEFDALIKSTKT